jgi:hypothetical protein
VPFDAEDSSLRTLILWNGVVIPALVSAGVLLVCWPVWRRAIHPETGVWPLALAIGLGYVIGQVRIEGWRPFPPREAADRLWYFALIAVVLSFLDVWRSYPGWLRWSLRTALWSAVVWFLLPPSFRKEASRAEVATWLAGLGLAGLSFWTVLATTARRVPGALVPAVVLIASLATVGVFATGHSFKLTQLAGVLAATLVPVLLRTFINPPATTVTAPVMVLLPGLWLLSYFYSDDEHLVRSFGLLALTILSSGLVLLPGVRSLAPWKKGLLCILVASSLAIAAVVLAHKSAPVEPPPKIYFSP